MVVTLSFNELKKNQESKVQKCNQIISDYENYARPQVEDISFNSFWDVRLKYVLTYIVDLNLTLQISRISEKKLEKRKKL